MLHSPAASARTTETVTNSFPAASTGPLAAAKTAKLLIATRAASLFHSLDNMGLPAFALYVPPNATRQSCSRRLDVVVISSHGLLRRFEIRSSAIAPMITAPVTNSE